MMNSSTYQHGQYHPIFCKNVEKLAILGCRYKEVREMQEKMSDNQDIQSLGTFQLRQDAGGIVDIKFIDQ